MPASLYGLIASVTGGVVWGAIAAGTGYIFGLGAIVIGLVVSWAVEKGAGRASWSLLALVAALTMFAIFIGDIVGLWIQVVGQGLTPLDVLFAYPAIVAAFPGETASAYFFGLLGVGASARRMWAVMQARTAPPMPIPGAPIGELGAGTQVQVLERARTRAAARIRLDAPSPHTIDVSYETMTGIAQIFVDGTPFHKGRIWGRQKTLEVPLGGPPPATMTVRFFGAITPRIEVHLDGKLLANV